MSFTITVNRETAKPDLSSINFGMLDLLEAWAEREWAKKQAGKPSEWDQGTWFSKVGEARSGTACGTACCIAGKAVSVTPGAFWGLDTSHPFDINGTDFDAPSYVFLSNAFDLDDDRVHNEIILDKETYRVVDIDDGGAAILGLTRIEAEALFDGNNDLADVKRIMNDIRQGKHRNSKEPVVNNLSACGISSETFATQQGVNINEHYVPWGRCVLGPSHDGDHLFA